MNVIISTVFMSNAVAHSDEELVQVSAVLREVLAAGLESFLQFFLRSALTLPGQLPSGVLDQLSSDQSIVLAQMFNGGPEGRMMMTNK